MLKLTYYPAVQRPPSTSHQQPGPAISSDTPHPAGRMATMSDINKNLQGRQAEVRLACLLLIFECVETALRQGDRSIVCLRTWCPAPRSLRQRCIWHSVVALSCCVADAF